MHPVMGGDWGTHGCISSLSFMGEPIIMRNIRLLSQIVNIENVAVPKTMPYLKTLVQSMAPEFEIDTYDENELFETSKFQSTETKLVDQSPAGTKTFSVSSNSFSVKQPPTIAWLTVQGSMNMNLLHLTIPPILFLSTLSFINLKILKSFYLLW